MITIKWVGMGVGVEIHSYKNSYKVHKATYTKNTSINTQKLIQHKHIQ